MVWSSVIDGGIVRLEQCDSLILVNVHEDSFTGEQFCDWLLNTFTDIKTIDEAAEWGRSLFDKGLIGQLLV